MKQIYVMAALFLALTSGCKSEKKNAEEETRRIFQIESVDEHPGLQRMQVLRTHQDVVCKGAKFQVSIERTPSDNLPHVKSDMGLFVDNEIKVKIVRENGKALLDKTFTKNDFKAHLSEKYLKNSILVGLAFDDVRTAENNQITLAASLSYPMTDLYIPFTLVVSQDGKLSISKDEEMGGAPNE